MCNIIICIHILFLCVYSLLYTCNYSLISRGGEVLSSMCMSHGLGRQLHLLQYVCIYTLCGILMTRLYIIAYYIAPCMIVYTLMDCNTFITVAMETKLIICSSRVNLTRNTAKKELFLFMYVFSFSMCKCSPIRMHSECEYLLVSWKPERGRERSGYKRSIPIKSEAISEDV